MSEATIVSLLTDATKKWPDNPALIIKPGIRQEKWAYRRLDEESTRLAAYLRGTGIDKGDRVLLWAPNRPEWVAAYFGILKAGAVAVPLDVRSALDFVERVAAQVEAKLLIRGRQGMPVPVPVAMPTTYLEDLDRLAPARGSLEEAVEGDDLALIIFTSGTTGDPKGVMLTHGNVASNVISTEPVFPMSPNHRLLSLLPLSHMFEVTVGLLTPLHGGATVVYPVSRQPSVLFRTMRENRITSLVLVPQVMQLFMAGIEREVARKGKDGAWKVLNSIAGKLPIGARRILFGSVHKQFGGQLREIISGGAYLDPELGAKWEWLGIYVMQGYGTTEAAPAVSFNRQDDRRLDSVGRVMPGSEIRIATDGEVQTRGPNVTTGYWRNAAATAAAFEEGWYKTGDLGEIDSEGHLFLKGRKKDLIVLSNGQNVYPDDIEGVLKRHQNVADAVVLGDSLPNGEVEIVAILQLREPEAPGPIVDAANTRLADHQHIRKVYVWPEPDFPRTHTLKVKKPIVLEWLQKQRSGTAPMKVDKAPVEEIPQLFTIIAELTGRPASEIRLDMNLGNDLNLDSLGRVELLSYIDQEMGAYIDESQLGPSSTVADLEKLVAAGSGSTGTLKGYRWAQQSFANAIRDAALSGVIFPTLSLLYRLDVNGREHLENLKGPVLFAANHCLHLDNPLILKAMPDRIRRQTAIAAAADDIFGDPLRAPFAALLGNAFPFSREGAIRPSLERLGEMLDGGYNVLIYPEGKLTVGGPTQPFKPGAGLVATESRTPVIPIHFVIKRFGPAEGRFWPPRAHVSVRFGPLLDLDGSNPVEATDRLEEAVNSL